MGGYKSLKRVLGETHLGRKLRWLFGVSLFALIFVAFFLVDWIGEDLVMRNIHRNGREWVRVSLRANRSARRRTCRLVLRLDHRFDQMPRVLEFAEVDVRGASRRR